MDNVTRHEHVVIDELNVAHKESLISKEYFKRVHYTHAEDSFRSVRGKGLPEEIFHLNHNKDLTYYNMSERLRVLELSSQSTSKNDQGSASGQDRDVSVSKMCQKYVEMS